MIEGRHAYKQRVQPDEFFFSFVWTLLNPNDRFGLNYQYISDFFTLYNYEFR